MSRAAKTVICVAAALGLAVVVAVLLFLRTFSGENVESVSEAPVTPELVSAMRADGLPITINRVVSASSYGGWHGDGQSLTAYRYPSHESAALIAALQQKHPDFSWGETRSEVVARYSPWTLLPQELQPERSASLLLVGRPKEGLPLQEYVVDRSRGILYSVSNTF